MHTLQGVAVSPRAQSSAKDQLRNRNKKSSSVGDQETLPRNSGIRDTQVATPPSRELHCGLEFVDRSSDLKAVNGTIILRIKGTREEDREMPAYAPLFMPLSTVVVDTSARIIEGCTVVATDSRSGALDLRWARNVRVDGTCDLYPIGGYSRSVLRSDGPSINILGVVLGHNPASYLMYELDGFGSLNVAVARAMEIEQEKEFKVLNIKHALELSPLAAHWVRTYVDDSIDGLHSLLLFAARMYLAGSLAGRNTSLHL